MDMDMGMDAILYKTDVGRCVRAFVRCPARAMPPPHGAPAAAGDWWDQAAHYTHATRSPE